METVHEQIAQRIAAALDGQQDPDATLTLRVVRPKILDWTIEDFQHGDVIIEAENIATESRTTLSSRTELGIWKCYGIIRDLPDGTAADTVVSRMIETIRRTMLAGNSAGRACGGVAIRIDCPKADFSIMSGGLVAEVTIEVLYSTALLDGYTGKEGATSWPSPPWLPPASYVPSNPPSGMCKVTNIYVDPNTGKLVVVWDTTPA